MATTKTIVCLANSRKMSGRCIAGVEREEAGTLRWIRPISERIGHEVSEHEREYPDGSDPRVLDIVNVPLERAEPREHQSENWVIDAQYYWEKVGVAGWDDLDALTDDRQTLWDNGSSTYSGLHDQVAAGDPALVDSLTLIHVDFVTLHVLTPQAHFGNTKRRVQARFVYREASYWLWVTDPVYERIGLEHNGEILLGECYLTISLGEPFDGHCYKLVAAIIERDDRAVAR